MATKSTVVAERRQVQVKLPCGHAIWLNTPAATKRRHCDRLFLLLVDGAESIVREPVPQ